MPPPSHTHTPKNRIPLVSILKHMSFWALSFSTKNAAISPISPSPMGQDGPSICPPSPKARDPGFPGLRPRFSNTKWLLLEETCDGQWVKSQNVSKRVKTCHNPSQCPCIFTWEKSKISWDVYPQNLGNIDHFVTYQHIWIWGMTPPYIDLKHD